MGHARSVRRALPSTPTIVTSIDTTQNPDHDRRYWWCTYGNADAYPRWTLRNKGNFVGALGDSTVAQGHNLGNPLKWGATQEQYRIRKVRSVRKQTKDEQGKAKWEHVEEETDTLPDEYYAMTDGKLNFHVPNFSNPDAWDLYADFYTDWFSSKRPEDRYASMSAEDGFVKDERPASLKLRSFEYDFAMGAFSATDQLWFFLNRVIDRVVKVYPEKKFGVLVYSNNMAPPRLERVHPNMALVFAPLGICPLHHVRDPKCKTNRAYKEWFEDWMILARAAGAETHYYDYEPMGYCWNLAMICPRWGIIGRNYPWFHELGLDGHSTQGYDDWASAGLDNYLMAQLYWDADLDYHEVIADYARARFGAAADTMVEYYGTLERRMDDIPDLYSNEYWDNHLILTPEVRAACRTILARAVKLADTESARAHVQTMVDLQTSTDAMCDAVEESRTSADFAKAAELMKPCFEMRDKLNALYPNFMNATRLDDTRKTEFFTGGIYLQFLKFDARIKKAAVSLPLPQHWKGMLDTRAHAAAKGYHMPGADVAGLDDVDVTVHPDATYQTQREVAAFFYRTEVKVPKTFADRERIVLYFPALVAKAMQIWINGAPVEFDNGAYTDTTWRGPDRFWMNYNHEQEFAVTPHIKPGETNTIAFRAFKSFDFGGSYRRIFLLADSATPTEGQ